MKHTSLKHFIWAIGIVVSWLGVGYGQTQVTGIPVLNNTNTCGTPTTLNDPPATDTWLRTNVRRLSQVGISSTYPRGGDGSIFFRGECATGDSKADLEYFWSDAFTPGSGRTLGNITNLQYEWYRASTSTNNNIQVPVLRLYYDADGNPATTNDRGLLIYEYTYTTPGAAPTDQWVTDNLMNRNFYPRTFSPSASYCETAGLKLANFVAGPPAGACAGFPLTLSANTVIYGMNVGFGSGWNGVFEGAVDNILITFGSTTQAFNFNVTLTPTCPMGASALTFGPPTATFSQTIFGTYDITSAVDGNPNTGWAIGRGAPSPTTDFTLSETAVFPFSAPVVGAPNTQFTVRLLHTFPGLPEHRIGRFRLSVTGSPSPTVASGASWVTVIPQSVTSDQASTITISPAGIVEVTGVPQGSTETYTVTLVTALPSVTGLRLEVIDDNGADVANTTLPTGGPGRVFDGNFVLTEFQACAAPTGAPAGDLAVELGTLYAPDTDNNRIQVFNGTTWTLAPGTFGAPGVGPGQFRFPEAVAATATGRIFVADTGNNRIHWYNGAVWSDFATFGTALNQVRAPQGVAVDATGQFLFVSDTGNNRVLRFAVATPGAPGVVLATFGVGVGQVNSPRGLALDALGTLYIADTGNNRVLRLPSATTVTTANTATLVAALGSGLIPAQVRNPEGVAVDNDGVLYIADTGNNRILSLPGGVPGPATVVAGFGSLLGQVRSPEGVTVTNFTSGPFTGRQIVVGDTINSRIQRRPIAGGAWTLVNGPASQTATVGSIVGQFRSPSKVR